MHSYESRRDWKSISAIPEVHGSGNLRGTTLQNSEQDWLKTNLAKFTRLLQGQRDLTAVSKMVLSELAPLINAQHGVFYIMDETAANNPRLKLLSAYAYKERKNLANEWRVGEGLVGQCAYEKQRILLTNVPSDYIEITSGLGGLKPQNIVVLPIVFENKVKAVIEIASFTLFSQIHQTFLDQLGESIGIVLNTIEANLRTEELLTQSQNLSLELQNQQEELQQSNEELGDHRDRSPYTLSAQNNTSRDQSRSTRISGHDDRNTQLYNVGLHTPISCATARALPCRVHSSMTAAFFIAGGRARLSVRANTLVCISGCNSAIQARNESRPG